MNNRTERIKQKGCFSSYSLHPEHKLRLESFIKRNKIGSPEKEPNKSKSPVPRFASHSRRTSAKLTKSGKAEDLAKREEELINKEMFLQAKEEQLAKMTLEMNMMKELSAYGNEEKRIVTPVNKKKVMLSEKVRSTKLESLIGAENEINTLQEKIKEISKDVYERQKNLRVKARYIKETTGNTEKKMVKSLCEEILYGIVTSAVLISVSNSEFLLSNRENAFEIARGKMKQIENKIEATKINLEKEALALIRRKNELTEKSSIIQEKSLNIEVIAKTMGKSEKIILKQDENLKKREESLALKLKQIEALEKQLQAKEEQIQQKEKKRNELPEKVPKFIDSSYILRENSIKQKENEIIIRQKTLDEKKATIEDYKSKIKWRLNNIQSLEKKSERLKQAAENKIQDFNVYVKTEENKLEEWKERLRDQEIQVNELKGQIAELEKDLKEKEGIILQKESDMKSIAKEVENNEDNESVVVTEDIEYDESKAVDFAKSFHLRQVERKKEYEEISKEKKLLSDKINSLLNLH